MIGSPILADVHYAIPGPPNCVRRLAATRRSELSLGEGVHGVSGGLRTARASHAGPGGSSVRSEREDLIAHEGGGHRG